MQLLPTIARLGIFLLENSTINLNFFLPTILLIQLYLDSIFFIRILFGTYITKTYTGSALYSNKERP